MSSLFETSDSVSSLVAKAQQQKRVDMAPTEYKFVIVTKPVPCTICSCKVGTTREEQVAHYHSDAHIERLHKKCSSKCGEVWKASVTNSSQNQPSTLEVEVFNVDLEQPGDELSQISHISQLEFECKTCSQLFKTLNALKAHLATKKHRRNAAQETSELKAEVLEHEEHIE